MLLTELIELTLQTFVHRVTAASQGVQEGQIHTLNLVAVDQQLHEYGGTDNMVRLINLDKLTNAGGNKFRNRNQRLAHTQGHMRAADHTVCGENGNDAQETAAVLEIRIAVYEVNSNGIHRIVGEHNTLGGTGSTAGVSNGNQGITYVGRLRIPGAHTLQHKFFPLNNFVAVFNIIPGSQVL